MISTHGFIQYFVKVAVRIGEEVKKFVKEVIIESPIEENLMVRSVSCKHGSGQSIECDEQKQNEKIMEKL